MAKQISIGDIMYIDKYNELIEILGWSEVYIYINYWSSAYPKEVGTKKCRKAASWIIFKYAEKVGSTIN